MDTAEFRVGDLFVSQNGDTDIKGIDIDNRGHWVVSSGETDRGIIGRSSIPAKIISPGTITVDMFGNCFYRNHEYKMVTHARVFSLYLVDGDMTSNVGMFLSAALERITASYSYSDMCSFTKLQEKSLTLPVSPSGEPDWEWMEAYIRQTQKKHRESRRLCRARDGKLLQIITPR